MMNHERFVKTVNFELPDRIITHDFISNEKLVSTYRGKSDLVERNARMAKNVGLDVTRYVYGSKHHRIS